MRKFLHLAILIYFASCLGLTSCTADEEITKSPVSNSSLDEVKTIFKDSIAVYATAMQGTVNKTLLPQGCPIKYHFRWNEDETLNMQIHDFSVGAMPLTISFSINLKMAESFLH